MEEIKAKKSIKQKFIIASLCLTLIPLAIVGAYWTYYSISLLKDISIRHFESELGSQAREIERLLENVSKDLLFLSHSNSLNDLVEFKDQRFSQGFNHVRERLENEFLAFSRTRPQYYQIRYINEDGIEIARVDSDGEHSNAIPLDRLQDKRKRSYFTESMRYSDGQIYVSQLDINMEPGKFEPGNKRVVRFATPLFDNAGRKKGIVIINLYGEYLIRLLKLPYITNEGTIFLVDEEGSYISSFNSRGVEVRALRPDSGRDLNKDFPVNLAAKILSGNSGTIMADRQIITYSTISVGDSKINRYWIAAVVYPTKVVLNSVIRLKVMFGIIALFAVVLAWITATLMARRCTMPILDLYNGVVRISKGEFDHKLDISTGDEIGCLADKFNALGDMLKASREKQDEYVKVLEENKRIIEDDLTAAVSVQQSLMPSPLPEVPCLKVVSKYLPIMQIGGDFYDVIKSAGLYVFFIADVCGHGVSAALLTSLMKVYFRLASDELMEPSETLECINASFMGNLKEDSFITAFYATYHPRTGFLTFSSAGAPNVILYEASEDKCRALKADGLPIGVSNSLLCKDMDITLAVGDKLFMFTDGLFETQDADRKPIGMNRLLLFIESHCNRLDVDGVVALLLDTGDGGFLHDATVVDDITILAIERTASD